MVAIMGAGVFSIVIVLSFLIVCGFPLGELTMGGQYKVLPKKLRIILVMQLILQIFFVVIILQMGGLIPFWFSENATKIICIIMAVYLSFNTIMNFISKQKRKVYHDTAFCNFSSMFLNNHTVKNIKTLICKGDYHVSQYSRNI